MKWYTAFFTINYWRYFFSFRKLINSFFAILGVIWLIIEVISFFSTKLGGQIKDNWMLLILICFVWLIWANRAILLVSQRLFSRDIIIEIRVDDFFRVKGSYIIGSNTTFDTLISKDMISEKSLQGQFTNRYYDNVSHLDSDLDQALINDVYTEINTSKKGKTKRYEIGTVAKLNHKNTESYFVAIADLNDHGTAYTTFENIKVSLVKLWDFIANRGGIEPLVIPILGTGFSRIEVPREEIIKEIILSFIAACSSKRFAEKLTIVIYPKDFKTYDINLTELQQFLTYQCKYVEFKSANDIGGGTGLSC